MEHLFHPHHYIELLPILEGAYLWVCNYLSTRGKR